MNVTSALWLACGTATSLTDNLHLATFPPACSLLASVIYHQEKWQQQRLQVRADKATDTHQINGLNNKWPNTLLTCTWHRCGCATPGEPGTLLDHACSRCPAAWRSWLWCSNSDQQLNQSSSPPTLTGSSPPLYACSHMHWYSRTDHHSYRYNMRNAKHLQTLTAIWFRQIQVNTQLHIHISHIS